MCGGRSETFAMDFFNLILVFTTVFHLSNCAVVTINPIAEETSTDRSLAAVEDVESSPSMLEILTGAATPFHNVDNGLDEDLDQDLEGTNKEKRCQPEFVESVHKVMMQRRELSQDKIRRNNCKMCKEGIQCKLHHKCDHCRRYCNEEEAEEKQDDSRLESRANPNSGLSEDESRFYTLGSFASGPAQKLLLRLLNARNIETLDQVVLLAQMRGKVANLDEKRPLIIDSANVFLKNGDRKTPIDTELHPADGKDCLKLISGVNAELDAAMDNKKKLTGEAHLTPKEIDETISKAIAKVDGENVSPVVGSRNVAPPNEEKREENQQEIEDSTVGCSKEEEEEYYREAEEPQQVPERPNLRQLDSDTETKQQQEFPKKVPQQFLKTLNKDKNYKRKGANKDRAEDAQIATQMPPALPKPEADSHKLSDPTVGQSSPHNLPQKVKQHPETIPTGVKAIPDMTQANNPKKLVDQGALEKIAADAQSYYEQYQKLLNTLKDNVNHLPSEQQANIKKVIEEQQQLQPIVGQKEPNIPNGQQEVLVKLDNVEPIHTRLNPKQMQEAAQKNLDKDELLSSAPHAYKQHPKKVVPLYGKKHHGYKSGIVGNPPTATEKSPTTFVDSKLLDMKTAMDDLKQLPPKQLEQVQAANPTADGEEVACSHEESEEYGILIQPPHHPHSAPYGGGDQDDGYERKGSKDSTLQSKQAAPPQELPKKSIPKPTESKKVLPEPALGEEQPLEDEQVGSKMDWMHEESTKMPTADHLMGKFVPDQHSAVIEHKYDLEKNPHKMYFLGDGVKLPVNMQKHDDGSVHVSVDLKKLCNCKDNNCTSEELEEMEKDPELRLVNERLAADIKKRSPGVEVARFAHKADASDEEGDVKLKIKNYEQSDESVPKKIEIVKKLINWMRDLMADGKMKR